MIASVIAQIINFVTNCCSVQVVGANKGFKPNISCYTLRTVSAILIITRSPGGWRHILHTSSHRGRSKGWMHLITSTSRHTPSTPGAWTRVLTFLLQDERCSERDVNILIEWALHLGNHQVEATWPFWNGVLQALSQTKPVLSTFPANSLPIPSWLRNL